MEILVAPCCAALAAPQRPAQAAMPRRDGFPASRVWRLETLNRVAELPAWTLEPALVASALATTPCSSSVQM